MKKIGRIYFQNTFVIRLIYVISIWLTTVSLFSQDRFEHITIKDGLSNNTITSIIQTEDGYLWFGTLNGLNRYDGKEVRNYTYEPGNINSLSSNRIYYMFEDSLNYIWILTYNFQVLRFDPRREKFINVSLKLSPDILNAKNRIDEHNSSPSVVWFAGDDGGIVRIKQKKESDHVDFDVFKVGESSSSNKEKFIYQDSENKIWMGTHKGLVMFENDSVDFTLLKKTRDHIIDSSYYFTSCYEIDKGNIIFGTENHGLFEYKNGDFSQWYILPDSTLNINDIKGGTNGDFVISTVGNGFYHVSKNLQVTNYHSSDIKKFYKIYCDRTGTYWMLTSLKGISMFDPESTVFKHFDLNSQRRESLGDPEKPRFLEDTKGNIWIGIYGGGLCKFNREDQSFDYFYYEKKNTNSLSSNYIQVLFEDNSANLWIGTYKGGLNKLNLEQSNFNYKELVKNSPYKTQNEVRSITEDNKERIWVGTRYGSIYCCDKNNRILFRIPEDLENSSNYLRRNVYALLVDGNDLWVGTKGNGLYHIKNVLDFEKYSVKSFQIDVYKHIEGDSTSLPRNDIYSLMQDQYQQIWIGTYYGGLSIIKNPNTKSKITFVNYSHEVSDSTSLSDNRIRKLYIDRNNNLWVGTVNGLNFLDSKYLISKRKVFTRFYKDIESVNSLANNDILDIYQDLTGKLWVATYGGGLNSITFDSDDIKFNHYFRKDGLPSDIIFSILEDDHMNLWLGTDNGLGKFSAKNFSSELVDYDDGYGHGIFAEGCKYKSKNSDFLFGTQDGFVRFNPDSIHRNKKPYPIVLTGFKLYEYLIFPGVEGSPLVTSIDQTKELELNYNENFITISFAVMDFKSPDKIQYSYILENFENHWNKTLNKTEAVYKGIPPGNYIFKLKATDSNGILLDETRELFITIKPPFWKTSWAYILYLFVFIGVIYFFLKENRLRNEIKYENKLSEEKFKFFTSISHEFKTPLTLINNSIDDISNATAFTKDVRSGINLIKRNVQNLNGLIEQLIDFRRLQKGRLDLQVSKVEIVSYMNDIYLTFLPYAGKKKIKFIFNSNVEEYEAWIDTRFTDKIINNLLSNAFKFTPNSKKVILNINIDEQKNLLEIEVIDEGEGISQEIVNQIFNRFVSVETSLYNKFKGSGIGLSLTKELVQLHKGTINLSSKIKEGTKFCIEIPIGENNYEDSEKITLDQPFVIQQRKPFFSFEEDTETENISSGQHIKSSGAIKYKLLVIDDNQELREYLYNKLQKSYTVFVSPNGEEGIKMAEEVNPDLIITDLKMPKIDGIELTKHLKNNFETSHIPIILLTASSSLDSKLEGLDSGADDYITKPFHMEYLKKRIVNIISQRKQLKEKFGKDPDFKTEKLTISNSDQDFMAQVIELIEINLKTPNYTIDEMINELGYSRSVFFKKMKSVSGYAPKEFVRIVKMKKAAEILRSPNVTVADASYSVGYTDPDYFSKSFKNFFGETPTSYQKKYR